MVDRDLRRMLAGEINAEHYRRSREWFEDRPEGRRAATAGVALRVFEAFRASETTTDDDLDDPSVQCWHYEPDTPCDWNICRQPERLAAGDRGVDPAAVGRSSRRGRPCRAQVTQVPAL